MQYPSVELVSKIVCIFGMLYVFIKCNEITMKEKRERKKKKTQENHRNWGEELSVIFYFIDWIKCYQNSIVIFV